MVLAHKPPCCPSGSSTPGVTVVGVDVPDESKDRSDQSAKAPKRRRRSVEADSLPDFQKYLYFWGR